MSERTAEPAGQPRLRRLELAWRWAVFGVMPFAVALTTALAVTAYLDARSPASAGPAAGASAGPQGPLTLARLMNLSPVPERAAPGFTLTDQHGRQVSLAGFRGKTVLLGFFDPHCSQVCPVVAQELLAASHDLGARAAQVAFVGVNVDPAAESVAAVRQFTVSHGLDRLPNWYFLTGSTRQLARVWNAYAIGVELPAGAGQTIHADYLFFINPLGHERFLAEPYADQGRDGTGYLPAGTIAQWGRGIASYLTQSASG